MIFLLPFIIFLYYIYLKQKLNYWTKRNIVQDSPSLFFGNHFKSQLGLKSLTESTVELYNKYPHEKAIGYYRRTSPELIVKDLDIVKRILTTDFACFYLRGVGRNPDVENIHCNVFHADGDMWKLLRQRMTSVFTSAKIRGMFPLVVQCAEKLQRAGEGIVSKGGLCDVRELMACFTTDFIGACGFGLDFDTLNSENSLFRDLRHRLTTLSPKSIVLFIMWELFPLLRKSIYVGDPKIEEYITKMIETIFKQRDNKPCGRNDLIDLLLELKAEGTIMGESIESKNPDGSPVTVSMAMDFKYIVGQVYIFFIAGFETSSSATSVTLHNLAHNPDIQTRIQEEIDTTLQKYDNKLCYDAVNEMPLLSMALKEAMRVFPAIGTLTRVCSKRYTIPELNLTLEPGVKVLIPIQAIHRDEQYYDSPEEFRPERFAYDAEKGLPKCAYLPFGEGPRRCIGARLGEMQSLAGLAALLYKFSVAPSVDTVRKITVDPTMHIVQTLKGGLPLQLKPRN